MPYSTTGFPNLGHLRQALLRSHGELTELAALVVGTIEDMILQDNISIPTSAWEANTDENTLAEGFAYKADVAVTGLIANANVNVTLAVPSIAAASAAGVCQTVIVSAGSIRFLSIAVPTADLTGVVDAIQLAEDE